MPLPAALLNARVRLERRAVVSDDGYGNTLDAWEALTSRWAGWRPQYGREAIAGGRLEASRLGTLTLRSDTIVAGLSEADRVVFLTGPEKTRIANIRSIVPGAEFAELILEIGVAT